MTSAWIHTTIEAYARQLPLKARQLENLAKPEAVLLINMLTDQLERLLREVMESDELSK